MKHAGTATILTLAVLLSITVLVGCNGQAARVDEHFQRGSQYAQSDQLQQAIAEYEAALELDPENVSVLANLGVVHYRLTQLDLAIEHYQRALALAPNDADIHSNLGAAYMQIYLKRRDGEYLAKSLEEYQSAVELDPNLAQAYYGLGVAYMENQQNEEAIEAFERFMEIDTLNDPQANAQLEVFLKQLKGE